MKSLSVYRVRKINRANQLFGYLKYQVIVSNTNDYLKLRSWCFNTFGESLEYQMFINRSEIDLEPVWSWDTQNDQLMKRHIYLKDDTILSEFERNYSFVIA